MFVKWASNSACVADIYCFHPFGRHAPLLPATQHPKSPTTTTDSFGGPVYHSSSPFLTKGGSGDPAGPISFSLPGTGLMSGHRDRGMEQGPASRDADACWQFQLPGWPQLARSCL